MNTNASKMCVVIAASLALLIGFQVAAKKNEPANPTPAVEVTKAVAVLNSTEGNTVRGTVTFTKEGDKMKVVANIEGLTAGNHGFHIHEWGDCSSKDGAAAGGHFNPSGAPHAAREASSRHVGDLGNIVAGAEGKAQVDFTDALLKLDGPSSILGHAVIVHASADDFKTQPSGNAGGRQACGVIGAAKP